jgi:hypothetical protein
MSDELRSNVTSTDDQPSAPGKYDPRRLRLSAAAGEQPVTKKVITSIPVAKPNKQVYVRVHPGEDFRLNAALIELKESRHIYLVIPELVPELEGEITHATLFTGTTRDGNLFLWPVKLPESEGRSNSWNESAMEAASRAMTKWVRVVANMGVGAYEYYEATGNLGDPAWPGDLSFEDILGIAFKNDRLIESLEHPLIQRLRGLK